MTLAANCDYVHHLDELVPLINRVISDGRPIGLDIETGYDGPARQYKQDGPSTRPEECFVAGISFTNHTGWARYVPVRHDDGPNLDPRVCARLFWGLVGTGLVVAHGAIFELRCLSRWFMEHLADDPEVGEQVRARRGWFVVRSCTQNEAYVLGMAESYALKYLTRKVFGYEQAEITSLFPDLPKNKRYTIRFSPLDPRKPEVYEYACDDSIQALRLHERHYPLVKDRLLYQVEMRVLYIIAGMEERGLLYDWALMRDGNERGKVFLGKLQAAVQARVAERTGQTQVINLGSPKQLQRVLYGKPEEGGLGLTTHVMTKGGASGKRQMSTGKLALKGLEADPVVQRLRDWKGLKRLTGTYLDSYEKEYTCPHCDRTHPHLMQAVVLSGRFAASKPPYQQSPKKYHYELEDGSSYDYNFRDGIIAPEGWYFIGFDLSQGELRVIAGEAQEPALLEAFARGEDVHARTAALLLGLTLEDVGEAERAVGKTLNFALVYQLAVKGLADRLGISVDEAQALYDRYFTIYPRVAAYTRRIVADSKVNGYTESRFGRRHPIWAYQSDNRYIYSQGERTAGNSPVQGGLADYMKIVMVRVVQALRQAGLGDDRVQLVMNVHDSLEFYARKDVPPQLIIDALMPAIIFEVPGWPAMVADWHIGTRWGSVRELHLDGNGKIDRVGETVEIGLEEDEDDEDEDLPAQAHRPVAAKGPGIPPVDRPQQPVGMGDRPDPGPGLRGAGGAAPEPAGPRTLVVTLGRLPAQDGFSRFTALLSEYPGPNEVIVHVRETETRTTLALRTSLTPDQGAQISMALGGAVVTWHPRSVPAGEVLQGLNL